MSTEVCNFIQWAGCIPDKKMGTASRLDTRTHQHPWKKGTDRRPHWIYPLTAQIPLTSLFRRGQRPQMCDFFFDPLEYPDFRMYVSRRHAFDVPGYIHDHIFL